MNYFLETIPFIPGKDIKNVMFPMVQIMEFDVRMYTLRLANQGLYILQGHISFSFPTNYGSLKLGLSNTINGLSCIEFLLIELRHVHESHQMNDSDAMAIILSGNSAKKKTPIKGWITEVIWNEENEELEGDAQGADEDDEDDYEDHL
ncbi:hypothetical protein BCV72DRAFT_310494 [Rhizopus microsporus var. microsporus]|nr:hypothetical protein BCV72DRAFT_310494 [Rhizopus microsporus var. microsporus]